MNVSELRSARKAAKLSLKKLSELSGVSYTRLWEYENNRGTPNYRTILKIEKALGITQVPSAVEVPVDPLLITASKLRLLADRINGFGK